MPRNQIMRAIFVLCSSVVTAACGDDEGQARDTSTGGAGAASGAGGAGGGVGTGGVGTDPIETFCSQLMPAYCEALFACCTDPEILSDSGGTVEGCNAEREDECTTPLREELGPHLAAGEIELDEGRLAACVERLEAMAPGGAACSEPVWPIAQWECLGAFVRRDVLFTAIGDACSATAPPCDLAAGQWCIDGICALRRDIGDDCAPAGDAEQCRSLWCGADGHCAAPTSAMLCADGG
jgi:hypothetical protein